MFIIMSVTLLSACERATNFLIVEMEEDTETTVKHTGDPDHDILPPPTPEPEHPEKEKDSE